MQTIPCLAVTFEGALSCLTYALDEARAAATHAGFKNLDRARPGISANRTNIFVYFDFDAEYFPIGLKFTYTSSPKDFREGKLKFMGLGVYEQGLESIMDMEEARNKWNEWTSK